VEARNTIDKRATVAVKIQDQRSPSRWPKIPGDECFAITGRKTQLFATAEIGLRQVGETPVREILKLALKKRQAHSGQNISGCEPNQAPCQKGHGGSSYQSARAERISLVGIPSLTRV
jgi:hypothetical protein